LSRPMIVAAMGWTPSTAGKITGEVIVLNAKTSKELAAYKGKLKGAIVLQGAPSELRPMNDTNFFDPNRRRGRFGGGRPDGTPAATPEAKPGEKADTKTNPSAPAQANAKPDSKTNPPAPAQANAKPDSKTNPSAPAQANAKPDSKTNPSAPAQANAKTAEKPDADSRPGGGPGVPGQDQMQMFQQMMAFRRELRTFLHEEGVAVLLMDSDKPHGLLNMTGSWPGNDRVSGADPLPTLFVVHEHYGQLYRLATRPGGGPTRVEVEINNKLTPGPLPVYNTIGEIRGTEKPDEYVILGAHIDSWDLGQGTTDNGTGTCVVLEAARILSKSGVKPKRTIRFCLFSGEEQGLYGSREYVKTHKDEMAKTSMCLVHDTGTGKVVGIGLQGRDSVKPILEPELVSLKELGCTDINLRSMPGSDHQSFESAAVPGFAVQQDWAEYRFTHHSQSDTLDKAKEPDLIQGAEVMAVTALRVANLPKLLPHDKPARRSPWDNPGNAPEAKDKALSQDAKAKPTKEPAKQ
jgi:carboxypeptidase Q